MKRRPDPSSKKTKSKKLDQSRDKKLPRSKTNERLNDNVTKQDQSSSPKPEIPIPVNPPIPENEPLWTDNVRTPSARSRREKTKALMIGRDELEDILDEK